MGGDFEILRSLWLSTKIIDVYRKKTSAYDIAIILNPKYFLSMRKFSMRIIIKSNENFVDDDYSNNITTLYVLA